MELNPNVVIIYLDVACLKKYNLNTIEIKRMFVSELRDKG
jgi:hypothetical protein